MTVPSPLEFFARLRWLDGRPLLDTIEEYRRDLFMRALYTFRQDGTPLVNLVLAGRGKKNWKSADLCLAALYRFILWESPQGNDSYILANDEGQAGDDLSLAKKLIAINPPLAAEVDVLAKQIVRRDGAGALQVLPAQNATGQHGKTAVYVGYDEIHGYRNWDIFEAMAPDPTRPDALQWITSYDSIFNSAGVPLFDLKEAGKRGDDARMLFSWYSGGDLCTDAAFVDLPPEQRANPSMSSWADGPAYLDQQRRRLPTHKFRRLHLNLPGSPNGAFLDADTVLAAVVTRRKSLPPEPGRTYHAFVDMSGGSSDDAVLAIAFEEGKRAVIAHVEKQPGSVPFNPRAAVRRFAEVLKSFGLRRVTGDAYAGLTYRQDFELEGIKYELARLPKSAIYEELEPRLNAHEIDLLDVPKVVEQMLTLVWRGAKIDHQPGDHDDWANAVAGVVELVLGQRRYEPRPLAGPRVIRGRPNVVLV